MRVTDRNGEETVYIFVNCEKKQGAIVSEEKVDKSADKSIESGYTSDTVHLGRHGN